jgi:non-heme chloroperoxidase
MPITRSSDDIELAYRVRGDGPTDVLFLHGWAGSGRYFDQTVECLDPSRFRMITFDLRGHGDSGRTDRGYTLDQIADDAIAVADAVGAQRVVLVGYSMSGKFVQYLACEHPDRVAAQVLVAGCPAFALPLPPPCPRWWSAGARTPSSPRRPWRTASSQPEPSTLRHAR